MPTYASNFTVSADDTNPKINIEQYNQQHIKNLLNEAFNRAVLIVNKKAKLTKPGFSTKGGSFYTERFDHYTFGSGYVVYKGYWVKSATALSSPLPSTLTLAVNEIQSLSGSVSVNAEVTAALKNAIIGGVSSKMSVTTTFYKSRETGTQVTYTINVPANQDWTVTAWYPAVSASGTAYYRWWTVDGSTGITARPCGSVTPRLASSGFSLLYFEAHPGRTQP